MNTELLNTSAASDELCKLLPEKGAKQWYTWLQNNRNEARKVTYRIPYERFGNMAVYARDELLKFVEWEKSFQLGKIKLSSQAVEALHAFGVGQPGGSTTGRKLNITGINSQVDQ